MSIKESKNNIQWEEVYKQLEKTQNSIEKNFIPTIEEKKKILKARAKAIAQESKLTQQPIEHLQLMEFILAYEKYCIELNFISEVYPLKEITPLPCTPNFVLGIINVRGKICSVIDIKKFFNLPEKGLTDLNKVIIVHSEDMELGILADAIVGVQTIALKDIQPPLSTLTGVHAEYLKGITKERSVILDIKKILFDEKIIVQEQIES